MKSTPVYEMLFPEIANLHGDNSNIEYLVQCRPDARVIRTSATDRPAFIDQHVDLLYLGPMTEDAQLTAIERLRPHAQALRDRIDSGAVSLFTHNAYEVLGARISNEAMGYDVAGLGLFDFETSVHMMGRYNGKVMGVNAEVGDQYPIIGYKSQFSMVHGADDMPGFFTATRGIGRNTSTAVEGVRMGGFIGTSLIGPLLTTNPHFARELLRLLDPDAEPELAHENFALKAYAYRLKRFQDPQSWFAEERVIAPLRKKRNGDAK